MMFCFRMVMHLMGVLLTIIGLSSCSGGDLPTPLAPVVNGWTEPAAKQGPYMVQSGDTLYSIAWAYGIDYHNIITINHLQPPYSLKVGQRLYLVALTKPVRPHASIQPAAAAAAKQTAETQAHRPKSASQVSSQVINVTWQWPVQGTVLHHYNPNNALSRGIDIRVRAGNQVRAARSGEVVYAGNGIAGYGNLIIIKHDTEFLSAYAYNAKNLVHEGNRVKAGQIIALVGGTPIQPNVLHFEIRDRGQPVDPLHYLPKS